MASSGRGSRRKGSNEERALVKTFQEFGIAAEKISRSGYSTHDLNVPMAGTDRKVEVKIRSAGFSTLYRWLKPVDALIVRKNHEPPLVIMPLTLLLEIMTKPRDQG